MAILSWNHGHTENFRALISVEFYILINKRLEFMNFIEDSFNQHQCCLLLFFCPSTKSYQKSGTDASIPRFCSFLPTVIPEEPKIVAISFLSIFLVACGEKTIDGSSEQSMRSSIQELMTTLPEEKQKQFEKSVRRVAMQNISMNAMMQDIAGSQEKMRENIDGLTVDEILAKAADLKNAFQ